MLCCIYVAIGFFDPYTMVVYHGSMFVYADDNVVGYTEGLCDIFKEAEVMSIMDLDKMCKKLGYVNHAFYWYVTPGKSIENGLVKLKGRDDIARMLKELIGDKKKTTQTIQSSRSHLSPTEGSNAAKTDHGEDDAEVQVQNEDFFSEMIRQTASQNEVMLSILKSYKKMAVKNKKKKTQ
ncbi:hypothetical protein QYF36_012128 [Acer negundo]|nr:hypothetical protein QYF36_012128 [Acer negundo]